MFGYKASDLEGQICSGEIEATSRQEATKLLAKQQLFVLEIESLPESAPSLSQVKNPPAHRESRPSQPEHRISTVPPRSRPKRRYSQQFSFLERTLYLRQLQVMFCAGIPLHRATSVLCQSYPNKLRAQLESIPKDLEKGRPLSRAFERSALFNHLVVSAVKVGEESGTLDSILSTLADGEERRLKIGRSITSQLSYPLTVSILLFLGVVLLAHLMADVMQSLVGQESAAIKMMNILVSPAFLPACFLLVLAVWRILRLYLRQPLRKKKLERLLLSTPTVGQFILCHETHILAGNLSLLLKAGLPINRCLGLCSDLVTTEHFKELLNKARQAITEGATLSEALSLDDLVNKDVISLVACGEQAGEAESSLEKISDYCSTILEQSLETLVSLLEPLMIAGLGIALGTLLLMTFSPIVEAMSKL